MAELADAADLNSAARKGVWVRTPPPAPASRVAPANKKAGRLRSPPQVQPTTSLDLLSNHADGRIQIAAEEHQSSDSEDCDQRKDECVFRETLAFLAAKVEEQGGLLSPELPGDPRAMAG